MTESEAKTKWCPLARVVKSFENGKINHGQSAFNRAEIDTGGIGTPASANCIASTCMFWRWREHSGFTADFKGVPRTQYEADMLNRGNTPSTNRQGYCGAAGVVTHP